MSATERLLTAIVGIQHYITHDASYRVKPDVDENKCAACSRWDELQGAAMEAVAEIARLRAANAKLLAELECIAIANPLRWEFDMRDQFQAWAQNRARAAIDAARGSDDHDT